MRILISTAHRSIVGGVEKYLQQMLPCLAERGHSLALLYEYRFRPGQERVDPSHLGLATCGTEESGTDAALRFARDWKPDVVYSQGLESADLQSALLDQYPTVFYAHNYVGTCISGEKCHASPTPRPCDRRFGPACLALYYPRRCGGLNPATMWRMFERSTKYNAQLQKYSAILVASTHMRREYERHGVPSGRIQLSPLPNFSEPSRIQPTARTGLGGNLLFLGRLTKLKGCRQLLQAVPIAEKTLGRPLSLTIAGDGPQRKSLESFAQRHGLTARFAGWVGGPEKADLMEQADLLAVPSLWPEPFGLVGIEPAPKDCPPSRSTSVASRTGCSPVIPENSRLEIRPPLKDWLRPLLGHCRTQPATPGCAGALAKSPTVHAGPTRIATGVYASKHFRGGAAYADCIRARRRNHSCPSLVLKKQRIPTMHFSGLCAAMGCRNSSTP